MSAAFFLFQKPPGVSLRFVPQEQLPINDIEFVPTVSCGLRDSVESLFFFNPRQRLLRDGIRLSVEQFGRPEILERDGHLWIGLRSGAMQCLFARDRSRESGRLAGVALYMRAVPEILSITHLAVDPDYAAGGSCGGDGIGLRLIEKVRQIARRINGVRLLELPYKPRCFLPVAESKSTPGRGLRPEDPA
jgi:hypothetical protein